MDLQSGGNVQPHNPRGIDGKPLTGQCKGKNSLPLAGAHILMPKGAQQITLVDGGMPSMVSNDMALESPHYLNLPWKDHEDGQ